MVAAVWLFGCSPAPEDTPGDAARRSFDVVLVCLDTVRFDSFWLPESSGTADRFSPWGERAVRFARAQAPAPWTLPSVASVLTGYYPRRHGAGAFEQPVANLDVQIPSRLPEEVPVLAEVLAREGTAAAAFVAHPWFGHDFGIGKGFDPLVVRQERQDLLARGQRWLSEQYAEQQDGSSFLYLHYMEAHELHRRKARRVRELAGQLDPRLREQAVATAPASTCADPASIRCQRYQAYLLGIHYLRESMAELLEFLETQERLDRTVVILYSDHGEEFNDHRGEQQAWNVDPRGFFGVGHGQALYQELLHVPLLVWHPDRSGEEVDTPVSLLDVFPTVLSAQGFEGDLGRRLGRDLLASSAAPARQPESGPLFSGGIAYGPDQAAVLRWPWKRIARSGLDERLLFNLWRDPGELQPVVGQSEVEGELDRMLDRYLAVEALYSGGAPRLGEAELERLRAIGYLGRTRSESQ